MQRENTPTAMGVRCRAHQPQLHPHRALHADEQVPSTIMSRPGLLVVPAFGLDLTLEDYLASLRTSVGIARALSGSLLLPRFCNVPSHNLVDVQALRPIVPLMSESQARTMFVDLSLIHI